MRSIAATASVATAMVTAVLFIPGLYRDAALHAAEPASFYTPEQVDRGKTLYSQQCVQCHGENLNDGQFAPPIRGEEFRDKWRGQSAATLFQLVNATMPPTQPGGLGPQAYADVLAYIFQVNGMQGGSQEFPVDPTALSAFTLFQ